MATRRVRIAFITLVTITLIASVFLFANLGYAASADLLDVRSGGSGDAFDEAIYFSSVQIHQRINGNGEHYDAPSADVHISSDGDTITIDANSFDAIGDKLVIKCTVMNEHPDFAVQLEPSIAESNYSDYFDITINRSNTDAVLSNGGTQDIFISFVLKENVLEDTVVTCNINFNAYVA